MSTRATIHFKYIKDGPSMAIVYRHSDGYPDGLGKDIDEFLEEVDAQTRDNRFSDPAYLAAKWIVYDAAQHARSAEQYPDLYVGKGHKGGNLCFLGVGVVMEDPGNIKYRYTLVCADNMKPKVICEEV
jgi:hypothetical protein